MTTVIDGAAQAGAEGEHELEALTGDDAGTVHLGVIEYASRNAKSRLQRSPGVEALPLRDELGQHAGTRARLGDVVRGGDHDAVTDHARHAHGCSIGFGQLGCQVDQGLDEKRGRQRVWRGDPDRMGPHGACLIEHGGLDSTASAVDRQRRCHGRESAR